MGLIRARDPSGLGLPSMLALRLLMLLLHWNPAMRPTPQQVRKDSRASPLYHSHSAGCSGVCCPLQIAMRPRNGQGFHGCAQDTAALCAGETERVHGVRSCLRQQDMLSCLEGAEILDYYYNTLLKAGLTAWLSDMRML
jgi:hypothetical protein